MTGAVSTFRNEVDIAEACIRHLLDEGIGRVLVADASTDGTRDILRRLEQETGRVAWVEDNEPYHLQPQWMDQLAADIKTDWIIPFDADEFWLTTTGQSVALELHRLPEDIQSLPVRLWHHFDWDHKYAVPERLPKVAYRYSSDAHLGPGNHTVTLPAGLEGLLEIRHYQYRGYEHFVRKVMERNMTLAPAWRECGNGWHHTKLEGATDAQLRTAWDTLTAAEVAYDPIHCRHRVDSRAA